MRIITIANQKGGVGKTTTAVTLSHDLARKGYSVVLADLDIQGNAANCLGLSPSNALYKAMLGVAPLSDLLIEARPNLWLLPSDSETAELNIILGAKRYREGEGMLAKMLATLTADFCILDTGPARNVLNDNAHHAADELICPVALDHLALIGVAQEIETLRIMREHGRAVELLGILPTFYDAVTKESELNLRELADNYGPLVLPAIPRTTKLREAPVAGKTLWEYLPEKHAAYKAYQALTRRVLDGK